MSHVLSIGNGHVAVDEEVSMSLLISPANIRPFVRFLEFKNSRNGPLLGNS